MPTIVDRINKSIIYSDIRVAQSRILQREIHGEKTHINVMDALLRPIYTNDLWIRTSFIFLRKN